MNRKRLGICLAGAAILLAIVGWGGYCHWMAPTHIAIVNPLPAQAAALALNNDSHHIRITCLPMEEVKDLSGYDAIMMFGRNLFLDDEQMAEVERVAKRGIPIFTNILRHCHFIVQRNLTTEQQDTLQAYFENACGQNYRNALCYLRCIATPQRWGGQVYDIPRTLPQNLYYHREYGQYFETPEEVDAYLKQRGLYHDGGEKLPLFPE